MVTARHEAMHELFKRNPGVFAHAFRALGLPFDDPLETDLLSTDLTETEPLERRADTILRIRTANSTFLLLVEAQGKKKADKPVSWAYYLSFLHAKYDLPVVLLVVCQCPKVASWARGPLKLGPPGWTSLTVEPLALGPDNVPVITDLETAMAYIPLAALSVITHAYETVVDEIMKPVATAVLSLEDPDKQITIELIERGLVGTPALNLWRQLVSVDPSWFQGPTAQAIREEEAVRRTQQHILRILEVRGVTTPANDRSKILTCRDGNLLDRWLERSGIANTISDVFA
ncbi:hypothetical protein [Nocardia arthritidis]|uniref:Transposase (putative) YhgA-like domain-containing protein n=1 Tax=Nocardia arthritidis TaxID=228602 RepID=A0A6G9YPN0_9NOCA|nr:hypothetical protein [Nocardia arthritidis]QIS15080.1 hypothetical protein F5544_36255 [Nocardia arthritidis]